MRVLLCPDKFKGTLTARQVAESFETGWRRARPSDELELVPLADGGEGTLDALVGETGRRVKVTVTGPLGDPVEAALGLLSDGTAVVESARAAGWALLSPERRDPMRATTRGVGELIGAALEQGAERVLVCLGGSATNDGGAGMAAGLGVELLSAGGDAIAAGGASLIDLARIDMRGTHPRLASVDVVGLSDVDNPLCGPTGASVVYGPQKGASADDVWLLDRALGHLAAVVQRDLGVALEDEPGAGAAGGLGFGLMAFCGGGGGAPGGGGSGGGGPAPPDLIVTGEGALDLTSMRGKVVGGVLRLATLVSKPVAVVCGRADVRPEGVRVVSLVEQVGERAAVGGARNAVEEVAQAMAQEQG